MKRMSWTVGIGMLVACMVLAGCPSSSTSVTVPDIVGQAQSAALIAITGAGLTVGIIVQAYSATVVSGSVVSQTPAAGTPVSPASVVSLTVSMGSQPVTVPELTGQLQAAATAAIVGPGLAVGAVTQRCSNLVASGVVVSQTPAPGQQANPGTGVDLVISTGPCDDTDAMLQVSAGTFTMGRTQAGDDAAYGSFEEDPQHQVTLGAYRIGKYPVTNRHYCEVLNWALAQGYLKDATGAAWAGTGYIYAGGDLQAILNITNSDCNIQYSDGVFSSKTRTGLPGTTSYSMDKHPVELVSWYGAVAFCNWLSQMEGLPVCYDMATVNWPLTVAPPTPGGYRLPTEAEWERAAAWDGSRHWIYGITSDVLTGKNTANYGESQFDPVDPFGLTSGPLTSPVGWFNGTNISPNGGMVTMNSVSPVGAYDMCGNVWEWCGDFSGLYGSGTQTNPTGPEKGGFHIYRGGSWLYAKTDARSAFRNLGLSTDWYWELGFRLAKS